jgi:hypothetical protein
MSTTGNPAEHYGLTPNQHEVLKAYHGSITYSRLVTYQEKLEGFYYPLEDVYDIDVAAQVRAMRRETNRNIDDNGIYWHELHKLANSDNVKLKYVCMPFPLLAVKQLDDSASKAASFTPIFEFEVYRPEEVTRRGSSWLFVQKTIPVKAETPFSLFLALNVDELSESVFTEAAFVHAYNMLTEVAKQAATNQLHPSEIPSLEDLLLTLDGYGEYPSLTCNYTPAPEGESSDITTTHKESEEPEPMNHKNKFPTEGLLAKLLWFIAALVVIAIVFQFVKVLAYLLGIVMLGVSAYLLYDSCRKLKKMNTDKQ